MGEKKVFFFHFLKFVLMGICSFLALPLLAQVNYGSVLKAPAADLKDMISPGWKIIYTKKGDLNNDTLKDAAIIMEKDLPAGGDSLSQLPRIIIVLFKKADGFYYPVARNIFIVPPAYDSLSTCLSDPLSETEPLEIQNGKLYFNSHYWYSCGSYEVINHKLTFRFQQNNFYLIGYDWDSFSRSSGDMNSYSLNLITGKLVKINGGNMFDVKKDKPKTLTTKKSKTSLISLEDLREKDFEAWF